MEVDDAMEEVDDCRRLMRRGAVDVRTGYRFAGDDDDDEEEESYVYSSDSSEEMDEMVATDERWYPGAMGVRLVEGKLWASGVWPAT